MNESIRLAACKPPSLEEYSDAQGTHRRIVGHAAVFNQPFEVSPGYFVVVAPTAFDDVLTGDTVALFNHDNNYVLGRTPNTLKLSKDNVGLRYEITPPNTEQGRSFIESISRGDINQSSFGAIVSETNEEISADEVLTRTILKCSRLYDVSPVTFAANPSADVDVAEFSRRKDSFLHQSGGFKKSKSLIRARRVLALSGTRR